MSAFKKSICCSDGVSGGGGVGHGFCVWIGFTVEKPAGCSRADAEVMSSTLYRALKGILPCLVRDGVGP